MPIALSRRAFVRGTVSAVAAVPYLLAERQVVAATPVSQYPRRVAHLMQECTVVDMLNQFLYRT